MTKSQVSCFLRHRVHSQYSISVRWRQTFSRPTTELHCQGIMGIGAWPWLC